MSALKNFGLDKLIENVVKEIGPKFFAEGANAVADKMAPHAAKLLKNGVAEGGKMMNVIKEVRKLKR